MPLTKIAQAMGGWKAGASFVGGIVTALLLGMGWLAQPIEANTAANEETRALAIENNQRIERLEDGQRLVRCWVRHEIQGTDASVCLVEGDS